MAASLATFAFGRLLDKPKVSHLANDLLQAQILSEIMVDPLKLATQRLRPYQMGSCGFNCSFPSGHFENRGPGVQLAVAASEILADVDADRLQIAIRNVLENAIKYSLADSRPVVVSADVKDAQLVIE